MIPQIINIFGLPINSFGLMICLAMVAAVYELERSFAIYKIDKKLAEKFVVWGGFSGLIGARLWYVFVSHYEENSQNLFEALTAMSGFTFYGGFIVSFIVIVSLIIINKINFSDIANALSCALALGYGIGRLGCQLSGDGDYGISTSSFLGMSYLTGVIPTDPGVLAYPTPLYETFFAFIVYLILRRIQFSQYEKYANCLAIYLVLMALERFFIEFLRIENVVLSNLTEAQVISIFLFSAGIIWLSINLILRKINKT